MKPDLIIPFKLDRKQAEQKLRDHLKGKVLLPKYFKTENRIKEVKGLYVPFWLYDSDASAEIRCRGTRVHSWSDGDYEYTETEHFLVSRGGDLGFDKVPVDGSEKMANDLMESIEPFRYGEAVPFQKGYMAGYLADRYDQSSEECAPRANERMRESTVQGVYEHDPGLCDLRSGAHGHPAEKGGRFPMRSFRYGCSAQSIGTRAIHLQ